MGDFSPSLLGAGSLSKSAEERSSDLFVMTSKEEAWRRIVSDSPQSDRIAVIRLGFACCSKP
jgi:hypothetical protein